MNIVLIAHVIILNDKNEVLITKRSATDNILPGYWDTPGGRIEDGEDPEVGVIRETKEETRLTIENPKLFFQKSSVDLEKSTQYITLVFLAKYNGGNIILNPDDHEEYKWIKIEDVIEYKAVGWLGEISINLNIKKSI